MMLYCRAEGLHDTTIHRFEHHSQCEVGVQVPGHRAEGRMLTRRCAETLCNAR